MAIPKVIKKVGKVLGGLFLGLSGGWLLTVCVGGILTLGALSLFHLGVLLSLGAIGLCLLVVGGCVLYDACITPTVSTPSSVEIDDSLHNKEILLCTKNMRSKRKRDSKEYYDSNTPFYHPYTEISESRTQPTYSQQLPSGNLTSHNPFLMD